MWTKRIENREFRYIKESKPDRKISFHILLWLVGILLTLLKGIWTNPWGVDFFDLDFLTILTAYLFLSSGQLAAGSFALGQGILIDLFSTGLQGSFSLALSRGFLGDHHCFQVFQSQGSQRAGDHCGDCNSFQTDVDGFACRLFFPIS